MAWPYDNTWTPTPTEETEDVENLSNRSKAIIVKRNESNDDKEHHDVVVGSPMTQRRISTVASVPQPMDVELEKPNDDEHEDL